MNNIVIHTKSATILEQMLKLSVLNEVDNKYYFIVDTRLFTDGKYDCSIDDAKNIIKKYLTSGNYEVINRKDVILYGLSLFAEDETSGKALYTKVMNSVGATIKIVTPAYLNDKYKITKALFIDDDVVIIKNIPDDWFNKKFFRIVDGSATDYYEIDGYPTVFTDEKVTTSTWEGYLLVNPQKVQANAGTIILSFKDDYKKFITNLFNNSTIQGYYYSVQAGTAASDISQLIYLMDEKFWGFYYAYYMQANADEIEDGNDVIMTLDDVCVVKFDDDFEKYNKSREANSLPACSIVHCIKEPKIVNMQKASTLWASASIESA